MNTNQKKDIADKVKKRFGGDLTGRTFALWGLSFKPETDDMREAPSITVIKALTSAGANIKAYDPKAMKEAKAFYLKGNTAVEYKDSKYFVLSGSDALILLTEWLVVRSAHCSAMHPWLSA